MAGEFLSNRLIQGLFSAGKRASYKLFRADVRHSEDEHRREFMRCAFHMLSFNGISGDYAEFGSHGGTTFAMAYRETKHWKSTRRLWAFDSFSGLPEQVGEEDYHPGWKKGKMTTSLDSFVDKCRRSGIPDQAYTTVPGFYDDTLTDNSLNNSSRPDDIALAYVDCDMYSSTKLVLEFLKPRLKHGMVIAFDDYFCFSDRTISGERKAFLDVLGGNKTYQFLPYVQYGWHGMSFITEDRQLVGKNQAISL